MGCEGNHNGTKRKGIMNEGITSRGKECFNKMHLMEIKPFGVEGKPVGARGRLKHKYDHCDEAANLPDK